MHVEVRLALHLDLDQVAEAKHLVLVAVLHQYVEVGVHQARLVAVCNLERHRSDAVLGVRLVFALRVVRRVDEFQPDAAVPSDFVLGQEILHLRHQRGQQRVGLGAEIAAQQQRLLQLAEVAPGGIRNRVLVALGHVPTQEADRREPDIRDQDVGGEEAQHQPPLPMAPRVAVFGPAVRVHRVDVHREEDAHHRGVEVEVAQVQDAARDRLEPRAGADAAQHVGHLVADQFGQERTAGQVEDAAAEHGQDQGDDLVLGPRREPQSDAEIRGTEQGGRHVAGKDGAPVQVAQHRDRNRQRQREQQRDQQQRPTCHELPDHELIGVGGHGDHELQRARATLVAPHPHREGRGEEDQQDRQRLEHRPHVGDVAGEEGFAPEEHEQRRAQERREEQVRDGRRKNEGEFLGRDP